MTRSRLENTSTPTFYRQQAANRSRTSSRLNRQSSSQVTQTTPAAATHSIRSSSATAPRRAGVGNTTNNVATSRLSRTTTPATTTARNFARQKTKDISPEEEKRQCRQLRLQNWLLVGITAASGLLYLTVIFPFLVQYSGQLNSEKYVAPDHSVRPQTPLLNTPVSDTNEPELKLTGFATPSTTLHFIHNGDESRANEIEVSISGEFTHTLHLREGENTIQAYATDDAGRESNQTKVYTVNLDTVTPSLDLETPENHQEFTGRANQTITVSGHTEPKARVVVNSSATRADSDGNFSLTYRLNEGSNTLDITASDAAENEEQVTLTVQFSL